LARGLGHVDAGQGDRDGGGSEEGQGGEELHCDDLFLDSCSKRLTKIDLIVGENCQWMQERIEQGMVWWRNTRWIGRQSSKMEWNVSN